MHEDLRWAARFAFLEELWRDRARVVLDPGLEAWLAAGAADDEQVQDDPLADLVDRLVPARAGEPRSFMAARSPATARELARTRPATGFVAVDGLAEVLAHREWGFALVDVEGFAYDDEHTAVGRSDLTEVDRERLGPLARRVIDQLAEGVRAGKAVALVLPARDDSGRGLAFTDDEAIQLLSDRLGGGRLYGLYCPTMTALVDYGPVTEGAAQRDADQDVPAEDDEADEDEPDERDDEDDPRTQSLDPEDEVPLSFDNTLGTQEPAVEQWLLLAGAPAIAEGLSLLEVRQDELMPSVAMPSTWQTQLHETQRQADLRAIEVQGWVERVDALTTDNDDLRRRLEQTEDALARALHAAHEHDDLGVADDAIVPELDRRLEVAAAEVQSLRWRIAGLEEQLELARARPVHELEAELARLRARTGAGPAAEAPARPTNGEPPAGATAAATHGEPSRDELVAATAGSPHGGLQIRSAVRELGVLLARVERGGISALELRTTLLHVRRRLLR